MYFVEWLQEKEGFHVSKLFKSNISSRNLVDWIRITIFLKSEFGKSERPDLRRLKSAQRLVDQRVFQSVIP